MPRQDIQCRACHFHDLLSGMDLPMPQTFECLTRRNLAHRETLEQGTAPCEHPDLS
jgi:hypothetical protein